MGSEPLLRDHVLYLLQGGNAHISFECVVSDWPLDLVGLRAIGIPHTAWRLVEHMRIAQWDILEFSRNPQHVSPSFPEGYWPQTDAPPNQSAWEDAIHSFQSDLRAMCALVENPQTDLFTPFAHGTGQTLLREALLLADHNAYHIGQLAIIRHALVAD